MIQHKNSKTDIDLKSNVTATAYCLILLLVLGFQINMIAQTKTDSVQHPTIFSGNISFTNNGFSIVPTFSFNSPAINTQMSWKKNNFSIEPDIRLAPDLTKGSMLLWFRYAVLQKGNFSLRAGIHPAINWFPKIITENGANAELFQLRRFLAWELAPNLKINNHIHTGVYYLQGNGLQTNGARTTHFVNLYMGFSNIALNDVLRINFTPSFYYLYLDKKEGTYFTATGSISHKRSPFSFQSSLNQIIQTKITGGKDFIWNVALVYKLK